MTKKDHIILLISSGRGLTSAEIAEEVGVSSNHVRAIACMERLQLPTMWERICQLKTQVENLRKELQGRKK